MKEVKLFGKTFSVFALVGVLMLLTVSAALITYFGRITTDVAVEQAVTLTGPGCVDNDCTDTASIAGGETFSSEQYVLTSITSAMAPIEIVSSITPDDPGVVVTNIYALQVSGAQGTENRIYIAGTDDGLDILDDLDTLSFMQYVEAGYIGHVDVLLDFNDDGIADDALVFEYDKVAAPSDQAIGDMAYTRDAWVDTFDDKGIVDDSAKAWLSSGDAGPVGNPGFVYGTLADWKAGTVDGSIDANTKIVGIEIEVDNWVVDSEVNIKSIEINGNPNDLITLQPGQTLDFFTEAMFTIAHVGDYDLITQVNIRS